MNLNQAKTVLKKYWPNPSISRAQLVLLCKKFKKSKICHPKLAQAANVLLQKNTVINDNVITKNPLPLGLVKAGQFGGKILARRAGAAGLAFGAGPIAGAATTTAGVILTGRDLYQYLKTLRKTKKIKTKRKTVKKNRVTKRK